MVGATGAAVTTMLNAWVALGSVPLPAVTVPANVPAVVGVPLRTPAPVSVRPPGRVPAVTL